MADLPISGLSAVTSLTGSESFPVVSGGTTKKATISQVVSRLQADVRDYGADPTGVSDSRSAIQAAIDAVAALGGGSVYLPAGVYKVLTALVPKINVRIYGDGYNVSKDGLFNVLTGTILRGNSTAPCFAYNATDLGGDYASLAAALDDCLSGVHIESLAMDAFTYGIKSGALYATGCFESFFSNLLATNCTKWGFYFENSSNNEYKGLKSSFCGTTGDGTTGQMAFGASTVRYNHGNCLSAHKFAVYGKDGTWGIKVFARNGARYNDHNIYQVQCNTSNTKYSQSATMTNGSADIAVSDGTKFTVDMPVCFTTSVNGFIAYRTYFVTSQVSNTIQVGNRIGGSAVSSTGNTAITIERYGYPGVAVVGDQGSSAIIQPIMLSGVDSEGKATCQVLLQNAYVNADLCYIDGGQGTQNATCLVVRGCFGNLRATQPISYDSDYNSGFISNGILLRTGDTQPVPQYAPFGVYRDKSSRLVNSFGCALEKTGAVIAAPADTSENILKTYTVHGNQLGANGWMRLTLHATCTNNANVKTVRVRLGGIGGTVIAERNLASTLGGAIIVSFANRNSASSQEASLVSGMTDGGAVFAWGKTTHSVDTTADFTIVITWQKATAGDTASLERSLLELFHGQ